MNQPMKRLVLPAIASMAVLASGCDERAERAGANAERNLDRAGAKLEAGAERAGQRLNQAGERADAAVDR
jgi:hypothetical protein